MILILPPARICFVPSPATIFSKTVVHFFFFASGIGVKYTIEILSVHTCPSFGTPLHDLPLLPGTPKHTSQPSLRPNSGAYNSQVYMVQTTLKCIQVQTTIPLILNTSTLQHDMNCCALVSTVTQLT